MRLRTMEFDNGLLDFHTHSNHSDGSFSPAELVKKAKEKGVSALALTDHNLISGLKEFNEACKEYEIFAIPFGVEIFAELPANILSAGDNDSPDLILLGKNVKENKIKDYHSILLKDRTERWFPEAIDKLQKLGFYIPLINIKEQVKDLGVPDIIHNFIYEKNNLKTLKQYLYEINTDFEEKEVEKNPIRFLNKYVYSIGRPAYVKRVKGFRVDDAIQLAEEMNCKLFIAHPGGEYGFLSDKTLDYFIQKKVHGIEVRNYFNTQEQNIKFDRLAKKNNLIRSGGSDSHGKNSPAKIGNYDRPENQLPKDILKELWEGLL